MEDKIRSSQVSDGAQDGTRQQSNSRSIRTSNLAVILSCNVMSMSYVLAFFHFRERNSWHFGQTMVAKRSSYHDDTIILGRRAREISFD